MKTPVYIIVAVDEQNGIGKHGKLPWHFSKELQYFARITKETSDPSKQNAVIMGRKTWESIPEKYRPLPGRHNIVLSRQSQPVTADNFANSLDSALELANNPQIEKIFIIGGAQIFKEAIQHPDIDGIYLTRIHKTYDCDVFFPHIPANFTAEKLAEDSEKGTRLEYLKFHR